LLNIYRSRESIDREGFIYDKIKEGGKATLVLVPDQYTLTAERQAMDRLKTDILLDVEITGISHFGSNLLKETGKSSLTYVDRIGRHMLISRILKELEDELVYFAGFYNRESFVKAINDYISAAKQHELSPEALKLLGEKYEGDTSQGAFSGKLHDLALIYERYEQSLEGKYTDNEDLIDLYIQACRESKKVRENEIWIYGFDSFTPKNMRLIGTLAAVSPEVNISIIHDSGCRDEDLFLLSGKTTSQLVAVAKEAGGDARVIDIRETDDARDRSRALTILEEELYALKRNAYEFKQVAPDADKLKPIKIVACSNIHNEAEAAAAFVLKLLRETDCKLSDIVVICNDQTTRRPIIKRVFKEYDLKVFDDSTRSLWHSPIAVYLMSLMDIVTKGYRRDDIIRLLKTGLTGFSDQEVEDLENYTYQYNIRGTMWQKPFTLGKENYAYQEEGLERIEAIRLKLMEAIERFSEIYDSAKTYKEFSEAYFNWLLEEGNLLDRINSFIEEQTDGEARQETVQIWGVIERLFNQIAEIMEDEAFDGEEFAELLRSGLSQVQVGVIPPTLDDMMLGTMQRTRSGDCKALIIIGANDDMIPRRADEDVLFSPEELETLSENGQELGLGIELRRREENLAIYRNIAKPKDYLWISYALTDDSGNKLRPSELLVTIKGIFSGLEDSPDPIATGDITQRLGGKVNTLRHYTEAKRLERLNVPADPAWEVVGEWLRSQDKELFTAASDALKFENRKKSIAPEVAKALYARSDGNYYLSVSGVEKYSRCPFSYFVQRGLKARELRVDETGPREIGDLYHRTLEGTLDEIREKSLMDTISDEEIEAMVERKMAKVAEEYDEGLFLKTNHEKYRLERAIETCKFAACSLVRHIRAGEITESYYEVPFDKIEWEKSAKEKGAPAASEKAARKKAAPAGSEKALVLPPIKREVDGQQFYIQGIIDRLDYLKDGSVKIIDYKTGNDKFDRNEAEKGYRLQLMLYMEAAREGKKNPGGVFYFNIKEPQINLNKNTDESKVGDYIQNSYKMNGVLLDDAKVVREIAGDIEPGDSSGVITLRKNKQGSWYEQDTEKLLSKDDFDSLQNAVVDATTKVCEDLAKGNISLDIKTSGNYSPCDYCDYKGICKFDTTFAYCTRNDVKKGAKKKDKKDEKGAKKAEKKGAKKSKNT